MQSARQGSIHLGRLAGVNLYLHWSWFLVAAHEIQSRNGRYTSILWNVLEYLALFAIVLTHEFGHSLACRQVGGTADQILLWPFGGVAYVNPPQRPGATLWSIAAGPLVNVALYPILWAAIHMGAASGWAESMPDFFQFLLMVDWINTRLLIFNILPIYPLDGGQILRSLLWFVLGRGRSLMVATVLGLIGIVGLVGVSLLSRSLWGIAICVFLLMNCWGGLKHAQQLIKMSRLPRRPGLLCPSCRTAPPLGPYWQCGACAKPFDTFESRGVCPYCGAQFATTTCLDCGEQHPIDDWMDRTYVGAGTINGTFSTK
jgi:Zn-dependent protease